MRLDQLVGYLDAYLRIRDEVADPPEALNGLQVANAGEVTRLAAAVDLCEATIRMAARDSPKAARTRVKSAIESGGWST